MAAGLTLVAPPVEATVIDRLVNGVYPAMALLGAMRLDLFSILGSGPLTADKVATAAGTRPAATERLLKSLVAAELLTQDGNRFDLTPEARAYLVADSPWSRASSAELLQIFWSSCLDTAAVVRGEREVARGARSSHHERFLRSLDSDACSTARLVSEIFAFPETGLLLDVGGGSGGAALTFAQLHPQLQCCVVELPEIAPLTRRLLDEADGTNVEVVEQDIVATTVRREADVVWAQFLLQTMADPDARRAIANMVGTLRPGGWVHLINIVSDGTADSARAVSFDLVLLNLYRSGKVHPIGTIEQWLDDSGAVCISTRRINDMVAITSARAPEEPTL